MEDLKEIAETLTRSILEAKTIGKDTLFPESHSFLNAKPDGQMLSHPSDTE